LSGRPSAARTGNPGPEFGDLILLAQHLAAVDGDVDARRWPELAEDGTQGVAPFAGGDAGQGAANRTGHDVLAAPGGIGQALQGGAHVGVVAVAAMRLQTLDLLALGLPDRSS
jgi:hypothetical protein